MLGTYGWPDSISFFREYLSADKIARSGVKNPGLMCYGLGVKGNANSYGGFFPYVKPHLRGERGVIEHWGIRKQHIYHV
jgi:hypothetical protein